MIPRKIHYCWFGRGEKTKLAKKCIASWKKHCPDYEIIEWNEDNFDVNRNAYTKMCYEQKKYAFLADYVRLLVVSEYGGIYFDTDVELLRRLDDLLVQKAFFGFENNDYINTGVGFGAEAGNPVLEQMLREYDRLLDGEHGTIGCPRLNTEALSRFGLIKNGQMQDLGNAVVYPAEFFNPYDDLTGQLKATKNTYSIHWFAKSWMCKKDILRSRISKPLHRIVGTNFFKRNKNRS